MSAESDEIITLQYDQLDDNRETKLSWCFIFDGQIVFLPKSQVEDIRETAKEVDLPRWLVEERELEDYEV